MKTLSVPTVHLNGTDKQSLLDQITDASSALDEAMDNLHNAWPNGRDYYVQGDNAYHTARSEWQARMNILGTMKDELNTIALDVSNQ